MLEIFYDNIKQTAYFYIIASVIISLVPQKAYKKYCRIYVNTVLVLIVLIACMKLLRFDISADKLVKSAETYLKSENVYMDIKLNGTEYTDAILKPYQDEITQAAQEKAWEYAYSVLSCDAVFETKEEQTLGSILSIRVMLNGTFEDHHTLSDSDYNNAEQIRMFLAQKYALDMQKVSVQFRI